MPVGSPPRSAPKRRHWVVAADNFQPIVTINTTPLIDVMLVLLIMVILTVPVSTHKLPLDLPQPSPVSRLQVPVHRLGIDSAGALSWDGSAIAESQLAPRLRALALDRAEPDLHLVAAAEARYERVDQILGQVKRAGITRLGFIGHQEFAEELDSN